MLALILLLIMYFRWVKVKLSIFWNLIKIREIDKCIKHIFLNKYLSKFKIIEIIKN